MNRRWIVALLSACAVFLAGCASAESRTPASDNLRVVSTFSILSDIVSEVGGEHVDVFNLVPVGQDPHEFDSTPTDTKAMADADVVFYNGLNLEGGENGWAWRMVETVEHPEDHTYAASEGIEPLYLTDDSDETVNPHAFVDPNAGMLMAKNVAEGLIDVDPANAEAYEQNLADYLASLDELAQRYQEEIGDLPEERRVLVTSERAFQYLAESYDLEEGYIWAIDTDEIATPDQLISTVEFVNEHEPPSLFIESNVSQAPMESIAHETGVDIHATVFSDELAPEGQPGDTYLSFLEENLTRMSDGLSQQ